MSAPHFEKCQEDRPRDQQAGSRGAQTEHRRGSCVGRVCGVRVRGVVGASHCIINPLKFSHVSESFHNKMMGGGDMCILKRKLGFNF